MHIETSPEPRGLPTGDDDAVWNTTDIKGAFGEYEVGNDG